MMRYIQTVSGLDYLLIFISSSQKLLLSRSTSDALLSSRISLPRVGSVMGDLNYQCDNCGYRKFCSVDISRAQTGRPQSMFVDHNNYVRFSFRVSIRSHLIYNIVSPYHS